MMEILDLLYLLLLVLCGMYVDVLADWKRGDKSC